MADIDIGWMKTLKFTTLPKPKQLGNRTYSANQIGYSQQFIEWMQQSYYPKGCLGDVGYYQNAIYKFSNTNRGLGNVIASHVEDYRICMGHTQKYIYKYFISNIKIIKN